MAGLAGKNLRIDFGSGPTHLKVTRGTLNNRTQLVDVTNSESSGHEEFVFGLDGADLDAEVIYTYATPALYTTIKNGTVGNCTVYPEQGTVGSYWSGSLMIETFQFTGEVNGKLTAKITGKITGGITGTSN